MPSLKRIKDFFSDNSPTKHFRRKHDIPEYNIMYFTKRISDDILYDDPPNKHFRTKPKIYSQICSDSLLNTRVFLDTHLIRFGRSPDEPITTSVKLVKKSAASFSIGKMPDMGPNIFITNALMKAKFREIKPKEFISRYLGPLDNAIRVKNVQLSVPLNEYIYPEGDPMNDEQLIQTYFNKGVIYPLQDIYVGIYGRQRIRFGEVSLFKPPFYKMKLIKPDVAHIFSDSSEFRCPDACFALGNIKTVAYKLAEGFEKLKSAIQDYKSLLNDHIELELQTSAPAFKLGEWSEKAAFALVLRKYLLHAFLCGTDRVFISDYQTFSGFFQYDFIDDQMVIDYYIINDPETITDGITLRSAIAGFFYKDLTELSATREKLQSLCETSRRIKGVDPFGEKEGPAKKGGKSNLYVLQEEAEGKEKKVIEGNTICRVLYDAPRCYPGLGVQLPSEVFVKLYHYSSRSWEMHDLIYLDTPTKGEYYDVFFNELKINEMIAKSQYASHFPKLFASGYWNGLYDHLMHIFEYLGEELPEEKWDNDKVYSVIKSRIKELHSLGISHNDIRIPNIHVSVSGKISLIDFGLSDAENNEAHKMRDLESLDKIFDIDTYGLENENYGQIKDGNVFNYGNYPSLVIQNEDDTNRNIGKYDSHSSPFPQNVGCTDQSENNENDPSLCNQNEDLIDGNEIKKNHNPTSSHQVDPFFIKKSHNN